MVEKIIDAICIQTGIPKKFITELENNLIEETDKRKIDDNVCMYYNSNMPILKKMCKHLYTLKDCGCGGPLHILLDDGNYDNHSIQFCKNKCLECPDNSVMAFGVIICDEYLKMSMRERAIFNRYLWDSNIECEYTCCEPYCPLVKEADEW